MLYLSVESENQDLYLLINSPGGWAMPGFAFDDAMQCVMHAITEA